MNRPPEHRPYDDTYPVACVGGRWLMGYYHHELYPALFGYRLVHPLSPSLDSRWLCKSDADAIEWAKNLLKSEGELWR